MPHFFDSSALAKLFIIEAGSAGVADIFQRSDEVLVSSIALLEVRTAIRRRELEGDLNAATAIQALRRLEAALTQATVLHVCDLPDALVEHVIDTHRSRALDAIQLASAIHLRGSRQPTVFVSADGRLLRSALAEGFVTVDAATLP